MKRRTAAVIEIALDHLVWYALRPLNRDGARIFFAVGPDGSDATGAVKDAVVAAISQESWT